MSPPPEALAHLQSVASEFGATLSGDAGDQATITINLPSGHQQVFELGLTITGDTVAVRELPVGTKLPSFCPDRHINHDGSFCLGWGDDNPSTIIGVEAARRWWSAVSRYLAHQVIATKRGVLPGHEHGRAHGDAAKDQAIAEEAAEQLGSAFAVHAQAGHFKVRSDNRPGHRRLELWLADKRLARVSTRTEQLVSEHTVCPCGSGAQAAGCGEHAKNLATFMLALHRWKKADRDFMRKAASGGIECCGTLTSCGLRDAVAANQSTSKPKGQLHVRRSKYYRPPSRPKRPR